MGKAEDGGVKIKEGEADFSHQVEAFTGGKTRIVWSKHLGKKANDVFAIGKSHQLMGFNSSDGKGVRVLLGEKANYSRPLITPDGSTILYSDKNVIKKERIKYYNPIIYKTDWVGSAPQELAKGLAVDIWQDPKDKKFWVYAAREIEPSHHIAIFAKKMVRFPIDAPDLVEVIWDEGLVSIDNVQLSKDGKVASCQFPWPNVGRLYLNTGQWQKHAHGCWPSMAPDNSYVSWAFDGLHRNLRMFAPWVSEGWAVNISSGPEINHFEVYHPRWSNHVRYFSFTGPYAGGSIGKGGQGVGLYLGKFNERLTEMQSQLKITKEGPAFYPDCWIAGGADVELDKGNIGPLGAKHTKPLVTEYNWPSQKTSLCFIWKNARAENEILLSKNKRNICHLALHGFARYHRFYDLQLDGGTASALPEEAQRLVEKISESKQLTLQMLLTPLALSDKVEEQNSEQCIFALGDIFFLKQKGRQLFWDTRISEAKTQRIFLPKEAQSKKPIHLISIIQAGKTPRFILNGEAFRAKEEKFKIGARVFEKLKQNPSLYFGSAPNGGNDWAGLIENIALYHTILSDHEAKKDWRIIQNTQLTRTPIPSLHIKAKLTKITPAPAPKDISPYTRSLVIYEYALEKVLQGEYTQDKILVAHWAILDSKPLTQIPKEINKTYTLLLEPFSAHPQLQSEQQHDRTDNFSAPLYYEISPIDK